MPRRTLTAVAAVIVLAAGACGASFSDKAEDARQQAETNVDDLADALGYPELDRRSRRASNESSGGFGEGQESAGPFFGRVHLEVQGPARGDDPANLSEITAAIKDAGYRFIADGCLLNDIVAIVANPQNEAILVTVNASSGRVTLLAQTNYDHQQLPAEQIEFQPEEPGCWTAALN
ncbi:MAG: hypothetical protein GY698_10245 [Actinomycetia bacterium]|nr:hypothetical protein [Actinomycetes bacterium]